jgi:hypothetical protein
VSAAEKPGTQVVTGELHRVQRGRGKGFAAEPLPEALRRPTRVAATLALAHVIQRAIDGGEIRDQAEAARRLGVTRARLSQILDLTRLAPDVQEEILVLEAIHGHDPVAEKTLRGVASITTWAGQRAAFIAQQLRKTIA